VVLDRERDPGQAALPSARELGLARAAFLPRGLTWAVRRAREPEDPELARRELALADQAHDHRQVT
jgi:hypothetical protein